MHAEPLWGKQLSSQHEWRGVEDVRRMNRIVFALAAALRRSQLQPSHNFTFGTQQMCFSWHWGPVIRELSSVLLLWRTTWSVLRCCRDSDAREERMWEAAKQSRRKAQPGAKNIVPVTLVECVHWGPVTQSVQTLIPPPNQCTHTDTHTVHPQCQSALFPYRFFRHWCVNGWNCVSTVLCMYTQ